MHLTKCLASNMGPYSNPSVLSLELIPISANTFNDTLLIDTTNTINKSKIEWLPIIMYDTDIGTGYGMKLFFLNQFNSNESFDFTLFNSTKGERWYRFVYSVPDFELRQNTIYPLAFDLVIDYDKMIKNGFYGIGSNSKFEDFESYTKEPLSISAVLSHSLSTSLIASAELKYDVVTNSNFEEKSSLKILYPATNSGKVNYTSFSISMRSDTRNSYVNPTKGLMINGKIEFANLGLSSNVNFIKWNGSINYYTSLPLFNSIIALRAVMQGVSGDDLPVQTLVTLGGTNTLRGSPLCRLTDKLGALINSEVRFPLLWKFGGLFGIDAGNVFSSLSKFSLMDWHINTAIGLRLYMQTFLVRLDFGLGKETTGVYFNFGHLF